MVASPRGWRSDFADCWTELALSRARATGGARGETNFSWATAALTRTGASLERLISGRRATAADYGQSLSGAVAALEACAAVWQELAPVAGQRQLHLVRRLEQRLEREEADVLSGQAVYTLRRITVRIALIHAFEAIQRLKGQGADRAKSLEALEGAAVLLAAIAVRAALNVKVTGTASGAGPALPGHVTSDLLALAEEIARKARQLEDERRMQGGEPNAGCWLSEALLMRLPSGATDNERDPTLRAESLLLLRSCWLRLGALQILLLEALDDELGAAHDRREALRTELGRGAAKQIRRGRLAPRPSAFDFGRAWECQLANLGRVVDAYCRGLEGDEEGLEGARGSIMRMLVRVTAALWLIDAQLGDRPVRRQPLAAPAKRRPARPPTHNERLARRVNGGGSRAVEAALELFERREPATFSEAVRLVRADGMPGGAAFDAIADAWETYHLIKHMPWD